MKHTVQEAEIARWMYLLGKGYAESPARQLSFLMTALSATSYAWEQLDKDTFVLRINGETQSSVTFLDNTGGAEVTVGSDHSVVQIQEITS